MVLPKPRHGHYKGVICSLGNSLGGALAGLLAKLSNIFNPFVLLMFSTLSMLLCLSAIMKKSDLADIFKVKTCSGKLAVIACLFFYPLSSTLGFLSIVYMEYADSYAIQQSNVVICRDDKNYKILTLIIWCLFQTIKKSRLSIKVSKNLHTVRLG